MGVATFIVGAGLVPLPTRSIVPLPTVSIEGFFTAVVFCPFAGVVVVVVFLIAAVFVPFETVVGA
jgi:hypothetical protein